MIHIKSRLPSEDYVRTCHIIKYRGVETPAF